MRLSWRPRVMGANDRKDYRCGMVHVVAKIIGKTPGWWCDSCRLHISFSGEVLSGTNNGISHVNARGASVVAPAVIEILDNGWAEVFSPYIDSIMKGWMT